MLLLGLKAFPFRDWTDHPLILIAITAIKGFNNLEKGFNRMTMPACVDLADIIGRQPASEGSGIVSPDQLPR